MRSLLVIVAGLLLGLAGGWVGCGDKPQGAPIPEVTAPLVQTPAPAVKAGAPAASDGPRWVTFPSPGGPLLGRAEGLDGDVVEVRLEGAGIIKRVPAADVTPVPIEALEVGTRVYAFIGCGSARPMLREAVVTEAIAGAGYQVDGVECKGQRVEAGRIFRREGGL